MEDDICKRMNAIELLAKGDDSYYFMLNELRDLERSYEAVLQILPDGQRDTVCDFVSLCEEMSFRKLELACTYMRFPE